MFFVLVYVWCCKLFCTGVCLVLQVVLYWCMSCVASCFVLVYVLCCKLFLYWYMSCVASCFVLVYVLCCKLFCTGVCLVLQVVLYWYMSCVARCCGCLCQSLIELVFVCLFLPYCSLFTLLCKVSLVGGAKEMG